MASLRLYSWTFLLTLLLGACSDPDAENRTPSANAGRDLRAIRIDTTVFIELDGSDSADPDGDPLSWRWEVVRAPDAFFMGSLDRVSERPVLRLSGDGLYIFQLTVNDGHLTSAPDYVNVWVVDGLLAPEAGPPDGAPLDGALPDGAVADAESPDADLDAQAVDATLDAQPTDGASPDSALPDVALPDVALPDAAPPDANLSDLGVPTPMAMIDLAPERVAVGEPVRLSGARSRRGQGTAELSYVWRLVRGPFGTRGTFAETGVVVSYTPTRPGRYTFRLEVSDGDGTARAEAVVFSIGDVAYLVDPLGGQAQQVVVSTGQLAYDPIPLGDLSGLTGFSARAGVLYATARPQAAQPGVLLIAAPGRGVVRRVLPDPSPPGAPAPSISGVVVPLYGSARLVQSDPIADRALSTLALPAAWVRGYAFTTWEQRGFLTHTNDPSALLAQDLNRGVFEAEVFRTDQCLVHSVASRGGYVYVGCRNQNAVLRVAPDHRGELTPEQRLGMNGESGDRLMKVLVGDSHLVALEAQVARLAAAPLSHFDLPVGDPLRERSAQMLLPTSAPVLDVAVQGSTALAILTAPAGQTWLEGFDLRTGDRIYSNHINTLSATMVTTDAADDPQRFLGEL